MSRDEVKVRWATARDARAIARVHVASWEVAYAGLIDSERLASLDLAQREHQWRARLGAAGGRAAALGLRRQRAADSEARADPAGGQTPTLVAEMQGEIIGFCALALPARDAGEPPDVAEIPALYVTPDHWGTGAGSALMRAALAAMRERGYREAMLWMLAGNERARRFYERHRFRRDGGRRRSQYFPDADYMVEVRFRRAL